LRDAAVGVPPRELLIELRTLACLLLLLAHHQFELSDVAVMVRRLWCHAAVAASRIV